MSYFYETCVTWIASMLYAYAQANIAEDKEVSRIKFTRWLKDIGGLREALCAKDFSKLLRELERDLDLLRKEPKKKTGKKLEGTFQYANAA